MLFDETKDLDAAVKRIQECAGGFVRRRRIEDAALEYVITRLGRCARVNDLAYEGDQAVVYLTDRFTRQRLVVSLRCANRRWCGYEAREQRKDGGDVLLVQTTLPTAKPRHRPKARPKPAH